MTDSNKPNKTKDPEIRYVPVQFIEGYAPQSGSDEVEIDLMDILKRIWDGRATILKITAVFSILGILYAIYTPNEYTTTVKLLPEFQQQNNLGRLGGLAAQFGLGGSAAGGVNNVLPPQMYPEILGSTDFLHEIIKKKVHFEELQDSITIQEFYNEHQKSNPLIGYTIGLPFKVLALLRPEQDSTQIELSVIDSYKRLTPKEMGAIGALRQAIEFSLDQQTSILTLNVNTQSPEVVVQLANHVNESLSNYLVTYRTEKSRQNLTFLEQLHTEARESFAREQDRLAAFRDQNQGNLSAAARTNEQNIQSEYNIKLNVYNSLTEQLEQARIKLQEDTPVVSIIQDSVYPNRKSGPNRIIITLTSAFLGGLIGVSVLLIRPLLINLKSNLSNT
jgi:uncharacterized protein involved in exopolysaccharide biosynthesis